MLKTRAWFLLFSKERILKELFCRCPVVNLCTEKYTEWNYNRRIRSKSGEIFPIVVVLHQAEDLRIGFEKIPSRPTI